MRFDYTLLHKTDDVRIAGLAYALVKDKELFVIHYSAPRLGFFPRYRAQIEQMPAGARLKSRAADGMAPATAPTVGRVAAPFAVETAAPPPALRD
ncbi:MAG TPA: hypothetical protein VLI72_16120 [Methylibium sp.]|nr:hypothetical protein [Methylibium sp.]